MIVHLTYCPLWESKDAGPSGDGSFDLVALLGAVVVRAVEFLDYCRTSPICAGTEDAVELGARKSLVQAMLINAQEIGQFERGI